MENVTDINGVLQLLIYTGVVMSAVCGAILWAIKLCVERLLTGIKKELTDIKNIVKSHAEIHDEHKEKLAHHEGRIIVLETKAGLLRSAKIQSNI